MQIKIENFGPIKSFDFDLDKDFHVIYGKNNIGKSYAMSVVYVVLKSILDVEERFYNEKHKDDKSDFNNKNIGKNLHEILSKNSDENAIDIKPVFQDALEEILSDFLLPDLQESFKNRFPKAENIQNRFTNDKFKISINLKNINFDLILNDTNELIISNLFLDKKISIIFSDRKEFYEIPADEMLFFADTDPKFFTRRLRSDCFFEVLSSFPEISSIVDNVFFLPSQRTGFYKGMNALNSVLTKLTKAEYLLDKKTEIPKLSNLTPDYFLNLLSINSSVKNDIYSEFANEIEKDILEGKIIFNNENKKLEYFNPKTKLSLDLSETSSVVSSIAPLVAHLKYNIDANKNPYGYDAPPSKIIFIEKPEGYLHPEIQVKLTEILVRLTKHNIKIVLTTHSSYVFNKINNLILGNDLPLGKIANYHMVHTEKGSIVTGEKDITNIGIADDNFADVLEKLYNERMAILD